MDQTYLLIGGSNVDYIATSRELQQVVINFKKEFQILEKLAFLLVE